MAFQYIICLGSRQIWLKISLILTYFNTLYVLVQATFPDHVRNVLIFQYIICFGSSYINKNTKTRQTQFQYIICFGSSYGETWSKDEIARFQYIICFGSRKLTYMSVKTISEFQYIICFGSSCSLKYKSCFLQISIHYMFWFKRELHILKKFL